MNGPLRQALADAFGSAPLDAASVSGGCISPAFRVRLESGAVLFVKTPPPGAPDGLLAAEASSLRALAAAGAVRVPAVLGAGADWLALEWLEPAAARAADWRELGVALARLHAVRGEHCGWAHDNFIGSLPQTNAWSDDWAEFWAERRLRPQLERAAPQLGSDAVRDFERLFDELPDRLSAAANEATSLLHGDLWSGNVHMSKEGPALIDPSTSYGHREVDLAMSRLFGGFPADFYRAYAAESPLLPHAEARLPVYQLYYLLVHVNLFGGGYVDSSRRALADALSC